MEWVLLQAQQQLKNKVSNGSRRPSIEIFLPFNRMNHYLLRQGSLTKARAKRYFATTILTNRADSAINEFTERRFQRRLSAVSGESTTNNVHISILRMKLLLIIFCRHVILSLFSLITSTRTWLFIFVFLICAFEAPLVVPSNPSITVFRVTFEVISAFGGCGLSLGFSSTALSLAAVLNVPSKITLILAMCMGRHRGLLDSMKDQEEIECNAQTLIDNWRQLAISEQQQKKRMNVRKQMPTISVTITPSTPPLTTRF
jgi:hypothetical protein